MENPKLGDEGFVNPSAINDEIIENSFASKHDDDLFAKIYACEDDYSLFYDDIMPPVFDDYCDDNYAIEIIIIILMKLVIIITLLLNTIFLIYN